ncbi:hypothetical protein D0784_12175 [Vibrio campbellii]|uniref:DUF6988 family protein n=1 Tax=Vibrio campbellii TaxID=680 RepID=UPI000EFD485A|nr:DUF5677 domain-containing protein [Vibrio campbellii]AYO10107.1 hypothetical protein D0784_12175 [Vibrio campbellii]
MTALVRYTKLLNFIEVKLNGIQITENSSNVKVAATLLSVVIDHAQGIRVLIEKGAYPSSSALLRVLFETYIRGMWLWKCADSRQVDTFINKDKVISKKGTKLFFKDLVDQVEKSHDFPKYLSEIQTRTWSGLNSLTHSGSIQIQNNFDGQTIRHCYGDQKIEEMIEFSMIVTCLAFGSLLDLSQYQESDELTEQLFEIIGL